ncbi:TonB family protein [Agarivorans sp.]|uniref:energy transducer TonB n=1 Tax=Agarivorans sp. TaxID=1872412 RepID=UPI003D02C02B
MLRLMMLSPLGLLAALSFFWGLAQLAGLGQSLPKPSNEVRLNPFLVQLQDSDVELRTREREKPPEPEIAKPLALPQLSSEPKTSSSLPNIDLTLPQIESSPVAINMVAGLADFAPPGPVEVSIERNPVALSKFAPSYPRAAMRRKIEGSVTVSFQVAPNGSVVAGTIEVLESDPKGVFDLAVKRALYRWTFQPKTENGQNVGFKALQTLEFKLAE